MVPQCVPATGMRLPANVLSLKPPVPPVGGMICIFPRRRM
ncbi:hypothetical protein ASZ90_009139 [hydrocarbon metagenome]|uniref:Uncharacterized protein n=1 Tax=hydrocarbon metagenome TaxID=938273 RepID=A0A0W8FJM1_9ZZZZ